jgi:hypothetical protein
MLAAGWYDFGSFHTHPGFGASQSSIDKADEDSRDGFHCTFGNLSDAHWNFDSRLIINGYTYEPILREWFYVPRMEQLSTFSDDVQECWFKRNLPRLLKKVTGNAHGYKDNFDKPKYVTNYAYQQQEGFGDSQADLFCIRETGGASQRHLASKDWRTALFFEKDGREDREEQIQREIRSKEIIDRVYARGCLRNIKEGYKEISND